MSHAVFHIEWCKEGVTGRDVVLSCLKAMDDKVVPDGVHLFHPRAATYLNDGYCEDEIWFSVQLTPDSFRPCVDAVRAAGWRVKTACGDVPEAIANGKQRDMLDWLYADPVSP